MQGFPDRGQIPCDWDKSYPAGQPALKKTLGVSMHMRIYQGGTWHLGRHMAGWSGVLEPKRGLPRENGDAQLNIKTN
jgi:hypothetical protein